MDWASLYLLAALLLCAACGSDGAAPPSTVPSSDASAAADAGAVPNADASTNEVTLLAVFDLPRIESTRGLSAAIFDEPSRTLFTVPDLLQAIVPLVGSADWKTWTPGTPITISGRPDAQEWDGEGITRIGGDFVVVTVETKPLVERFDATGKYVGAVELPPRYAKQGPGNQGIESLSSSPSGKYLFTANEGALASDGTQSTKTSGTRVRILRREIATSKDEERAYRTEPLGAGISGGDMGVSDVTAIDDDTLLVLERGYQSGYGNTVRLYRVAFGSAPDVSAMASLLDDAATVLDKQLVLDLSTLPASGVTAPQTQPNPILDNYESLALGPTLEDGRRIVFVLSDDNGSEKQTPRILVLAWLP